MTNTHTEHQKNAFGSIESTERELRSTAIPLPEFMDEFHNRLAKQIAERPRDAQTFRDGYELVMVQMGNETGSPTLVRYLTMKYTDELRRLGIPLEGN